MRQNEDVIALYSRKSKFTGKGESIGNQVELGKEYVRVHFGDAAVDKIVVYEDEGFSGGNLNRPAFKRMMDAAGVRYHQYHRTGRKIDRPTSRIVGGIAR